MNLNLQTHTNTDIEQKKISLGTQKETKDIFQMPDGQEKIIEMETYQKKKMKEATENKQKIEEISATEEGKKLGAIFGLKSMIYMWNTNLYIHNRLLLAKYENQMKNNEEEREVHLKVGGVLDRVKATQLKVADLLGAMPRFAARINEKIGYADQKISKILTLNPIMYQHKVRRERIQNVVGLMRARGQDVENMQDFYTKELRGKDTKNAYKNASKGKEKADTYLSHTLKEDIERVNAIDNFMMKRVIQSEKNIHGNHVFGEKTFQADTLTSTVIVKDPKHPEAIRRIPYSFDANGYIIFDGEVSLVQALSKTPVEKITPPAAKEYPEPQKKERSRPTFDQRRVIIEKIRRDKEKPISIDPETNKDFLEGKKDTVVIQQNDNPAVQKSMHISTKIEEMPNHTTREVFYAEEEDTHKKVMHSPVPLLVQTDTGHTRWAQTQEAQNILNFPPRKTSKIDIQNSASPSKIAS